MSKRSNRNGVGNARCDRCGIKRGNSKGWKYAPQKGLKCPSCSKLDGIDIERTGYHRLVGGEKNGKSQT